MASRARSIRVAHALRCAASPRSRPLPPGARTTRRDRSRSSCRSRRAALADTLARIVSQRLAEASGQAVVVENRPGGAGAVGAEAAARAPADGYTLFMGGLSTNAVLAHLTRLAFDPAKDLVPIIHVATFPNVLVVNPGLPVKSVRELVDYARGQSRQAELRLAGQRRVRTSGRRAVQADRRHRDGSCPLSRRRAGDPGSDRRPCPGHVRQRHAADAADQGGQDARARGAHGAAARDRFPTFRPWARAASDRCRAAPGSACSPRPERRPKSSRGSTGKPGPRSPPSRCVSATCRSAPSLPLGSPDEFALHIAAERQKWGEVIRQANIRLE